MTEMEEIAGSDVAIARRRQVFELVSERKTFAQIGRELGISRQAAYELWQRACADYPLPDIETFRRRQLGEIQMAKQALLDVMARDHVAVNAMGVVQREIPNPFGEGSVFEDVSDDEPIMKAAAVLRQFLEREAKLIGGDAPVQVEARVAHVSFSIEGVDMSQLR